MDKIIQHSIRLLIYKNITYDEFYLLLSEYFMNFLPPFSHKFTSNVKSISKSKMTIEDFLLLPKKENTTKFDKYKGLLEKSLKALLPCKKVKDLIKDKYRILNLNVKSITVPILFVKNNGILQVIGNAYTDELLELCGGDKQSIQVDIIKSISDLEKKNNICHVCSKKGCKFKSFSKTRTLFFCCIKCLDEWNY